MRAVISLVALAALIFLGHSLVKGILAPGKTATTKSYYLHFERSPDCPSEVARVHGHAKPSIVC
jgi:hypothetical protein